TTTESENRVGIRADRGIWRFYHATNDGQNSRDGMDRASTHVRENFAGSGPLADEPTSIMMGREVPPTNHQGSTGLAARAQAVVSNLDDDQRAAALARGPALVIGCAATGKTRVLAHRIAYLCAGGAAAPRRILAFARTKRDAALLRLRAERLLAFPLHGAW